MLSSPNSFFFRHRRLSISLLYPYTSLFRSELAARGAAGVRAGPAGLLEHSGPVVPGRACGAEERRGQLLDRKSTRLNSSHVASSYAVFCADKIKKHMS